MPRTAVLLTSLIVLMLAEGVVLPKGDLRATSPGDFVCGTSAQREILARARGRYIESALAGRGRTMQALAQTPPAQADYGDVAVLEDDGTMITSINRFDLQQVGAFRFVPALGGAYRALPSAAVFDGSGGTAVTLADDDTREIPLGFHFSYFGRTWDKVWLNSDGNLTFGGGDVATSSRDLGRFVSGPPRIGPLFSDLDPPRGTVSYRSDADGMLFAWIGVPDFDSTAALNSFSAKLYRDGSIEFAYGSRVDSTSSVVGVSPGGGGEIRAVNFSGDLPTAELSGSIVEVFSTQAELSETAIARAFFRTHPDEFDQLVVFLGFDYSISGAFAYELNTKNEVAGIGDTVFDNTRSYGSNGRLRSFVMMGSLDGTGRFPNDPTAPNMFRTYSTLQVLAHEVAHRWLAYPNVLIPGYSSLSLIHRTDKAHWSFFFNAEASVMEGNTIEDRGEARTSDRFATAAATNKYSALDRYLMGYAAPEEVPPMFVIVDPYGTGKTSESLPSLAQTVFGGTRKDFDIQAVIQANGQRVPSTLESPKVFRQAFVLLLRAGQQVSATQIAKLQRIHDAWVPYFNSLTLGRGFAATNLQRTPGTTPTRINFPWFEGDSSRYTGIAVANWGSTAADVLFHAYDASGSPLVSPAGIVNPRMITIPPASQVAMLAEQILGLSLEVPRNGWIQAGSSSSHVSGFFLDGDVDLRYLDGAVAGGDTYKELYFTRARSGSGPFVSAGFANELSLVNPGDTAANLTLSYIDEFGSVRASAARKLNPKGRLAEEVRSLFPDLGNTIIDGYVRVTSDAGIAGYQGISTGATVIGLPAQPASLTSRLYSAQFASGNAAGTRYYSDLNFVNTSAASRSLQLLLTGNDGRPVAGIANPVLRTLAPGAQLRVRGEQLFQLPDPSVAPNLVEGSLTVTSDGPGIVGDVTFGDPTADRFLAGLPLDARPASALVFSQVAQGSPNQRKPYFTGIAVLNPNSADVLVTVEVFSEQGRKTGSSTFPLAGGGRISKTLPELVPAVQQQVRGYIRINSAGGPVVAFELFGDQALEFLAAVPAQPVQ